MEGAAAEPWTAQVRLHRVQQPVQRSDRAGRLGRLPVGQTEDLVGQPLQVGTDQHVRAATLPDGGPTGGFFRDGAPLPW